jgi:hypothetical protein
LSQLAAIRIQREGGACPLCKATHWSTMLNKRFQRKINVLQVFCCHKDKGCEWVGKLTDIVLHILSCSHSGPKPTANLSKFPKYIFYPLALIRAVSSGDRDKVELFLREGADLNPSPSVFKVTPLIEACGTKGSYKIACLLLDKGADPNLGNDEGWTPLMGAAKNGHYCTVGAILEGGAHPDIQTPKGWTALMEAVDKGHGEIALRIIEAGATPHIQHKVNKTNALLLATEHDQLDRVVCALLDHMDCSSHLDLQNIEGDTALLIACKKNKVRLVKRLYSLWELTQTSVTKMGKPLLLLLREKTKEKFWISCKAVPDLYITLTNPLYNCF